MIYLDTSALVKLIFEEQESQALESWLDTHQRVAKVTSALSSVELLRICRKLDEATSAAAQQLLSGIDMLPMSESILETAAYLQPKELRSLDAIHLASALAVASEIQQFVAYDHRLLAAARGSGLPSLCPLPEH